MDSYYLAASPGGGGRGSQWLDTSMRRGRRLSSPSGTAYLTPAFNANSGPGGDDGSTGSSLSSGTLDLGIDDSLLRFRRPRLSSAASPSSKMELLFLLGSPPASPNPEDEVLVMDGVLVGGGSGGGRQGSKGQFAHGKEDLRRVRAMKPKSSHEVEWLNSRAVVPSAGANIHGPRHHSFPRPSRAGAALSPPAARGATNSIKLAADSQPPKATATLTAQPDHPTPPPTRTAFAWPPTEEEDAYISRVLYGSGHRRRLPVFEVICPA